MPKKTKESIIESNKIKKAFAERLELLIQDSIKEKKILKSKHEFATIMGVTDTQVKTWTVGEYDKALGIDERKYTLPEIGMLIKIANYFNVSLDYLLGISNYKNVENLDISNILGLTDKAIMVLKHLNEIQTTNGKPLKHLIRSHAARQASENIDFINMILEQGINDWDKSSILSMIYEYVKTKDNPCFVYAEAINEYDEKGEVVNSYRRETELNTSDSNEAGIIIKGTSIGNYEVDLKKYYPAILKDALIQEIEKLK